MMAVIPLIRSLHFLVRVRDGLLAYTDEKGNIKKKKREHSALAVTMGKTSRHLLLLFTGRRGRFLLVFTRNTLSRCSTLDNGCTISKAPRETKEIESDLFDWFLLLSFGE